jgi:hypothetical protein
MPDVDSTIYELLRDVAPWDIIDRVKGMTEWGPGKRSWTPGSQPSPLAVEMTTPLQVNVDQEMEEERPLVPSTWTPQEQSSVLMSGYFAAQEQQRGGDVEGRRHPNARFGVSHDDTLSTSTIASQDEPQTPKATPTRGRGRGAKRGTGVRGAAKNRGGAASSQ